MNEEQKREIRAKCGGVTAEYEILGHWCCFKCPSLTDWETFAEKVNSGKHSKSAAARELCYQTVAHPTVEELTGLFEKQPAAPGQIVGLIGALAGNDIAGEIKKG